MNPIDAASEVAKFLEKENVPYAIIGGLAVQLWGESRTTQDVDLVIVVDAGSTDRVIASALSRFKARITDPAEFARKNRVLLLATDDNTPIDISFGIPGYESTAVAHAIDIDLPSGISVKVLSPEDLIVHKIIAGRARDDEDVKNMLIRMHASIDVDYVTGWLTQFADIVEGRNPVQAFTQLLRQAVETAVDESSSRTEGGAA